MSKITNESTLTSNYELPDGTRVTNSVTSNTSTTENMTTSFIKLRETDRQYAVPLDVIKQTLTLNNTSEFNITNVNIKDIVSDNATFKAGSLKIDDVAASGDLDPIVGFNLPKDIPANTSVVITYDLEIAENVESDIINLQSKIEYTVNEVENLVENSNTAQIEVVKCDITVTKTATPEVVITGQTINFKDVIKNNGSTINTEVKLSETLSGGVEFVTGSVKIDDVEKPELTLDSEISLENLTPGKTITVEFQAKVL